MIIKQTVKRPIRQSIRLINYDYSCAGIYFVTLCSFNRKCIFGYIKNNFIQLNDYGRIARDEWEKLPERFSNVSLDLMQLMPNHMHATLILKNRPIADESTPTLGMIIGAYKSLVTKTIRERYSGLEMIEKVWQRNYYEHIIRSASSYEYISNYIVTNPAKWEHDKLYCK